MNQTRSPEDLKPEDLKAVFASLSESAAGGPDCPPAGEIWEAATGALTGGRASAVVEHTSRCFACAEAWRLAREFGARSVPEGGAASGPAFRVPAAGTWAALAAAVIVIAGLGVVMFRRNEPAPVMRAGDEVAIRSLVPETTPLPREACLLKWSEPAPGARYTVRVGSEDLSAIALAQNLDKAEYKVEAKDLEKLPPGSKIVWRVEATLPDGRRIASPAFANRLNP
ncbi:MAG TPA: hypothetical protein VFQ07_01160 [Candidatus Polarisedimenticolia bacterium]|nr:hypothetical protein [Candidatus Polarisedimenticolia bacterium]